MLGLPQFTGYRVHGKAMRIAVTQAPDFGARASTSHERIVPGDSTVVVKP
jgi:hypothetical protein